MHLLSCALISALATSGADINVRDYDEMTPLMLAIRAGNVETVSVMLDMGCDIHSDAQNGKSLLVWAIDKEYTALLKVTPAKLPMVCQLHCTFRLLLEKVPILHARK